MGIYTTEDQITRLGLDTMPNVRIASNGSWLESDTTGEDE